MLNVSIHEEFRIADMEEIEYDLKHADYVIAGLWSYPQIEGAMLLNRLLKGKCYFYGYYPIIKRLGLNICQYTNDTLLAGMEEYPKQLCKSRFKFDLLSDCDMHVKDKYEYTKRMVPMFTSYGCAMGCKFCSASANCEKKRVSLPVNTVLHNLLLLHQKGINAVHFTDEEFFFNPRRAIEILRGAFEICNEFQFIALGGMTYVEKFCDELDSGKYSSAEVLSVWSVLRLVEIGLESADVDQAKRMGKTGVINKYLPISLARRVRTKILWLTMTFAPGETISSLNMTGLFLRSYGLPPETLEERIVTNGTEGGLGQFFQYYHGCGMSWDEFEKSGYWITRRPMRLIPSYIPYSFLYDKIKVDDDRLEGVLHQYSYWLSVYGIDFNDLDVLDWDGKLVTKVLSDDGRNLLCNDAIAVAIAARLEIIRGAK
jgi:hypothetical protein